MSVGVKVSLGVIAFGAAMVVVFGGLGFARPAGADSIEVYCNGTNDTPPKALAGAAAAKKSVSDGHYQMAVRQAVALQKVADECIAGHQNPR